MSETTATREERRSALDEFAATAAQSKGELVPAGNYASPADLQHGALVLQVRRDEHTVFMKLKALAAAAGDDWYYRWPVRDRKKGTVEYVEGPSIKLANDLARIYGNSETDIRVVDAGSHWVFYARFIDLESGFALTRPFQQRKSAATMGDDAERKLDMAFQIGVSKAERNVITNALRSYADYAVAEAKASLVDRIGGDIERYRNATVERIQQRGVELARVEAVVGRAARDWLAPDIAKIIAMMTAVMDGMATLDETFPPLRKAEPDTSQLDQFSSGTAPAAPPAGQGPEEEAGAATGNPPPLDAAPAPKDAELRALRAFSIDAALAAARRDHDPENRKAAIDGLELTALKIAAPDFHRQLIAMAMKVANDDLKAEAARRYLEALP